MKKATWRGKIISFVRVLLVNELKKLSATNLCFQHLQPTMQFFIDIINKDPYSFVYNGIPKEHRVLKVQQPCAHCGAKRFQFEFPTFCCMDGKTKLSHSSIPEELLNLFTSRNELGRTFRQMIRCYNSNFSFASIGVNYDKTLTNMTSRSFIICLII
uniref:Uncharacterized protein n=1 Tax=Lactuca sativa TaxID=4236 RepID=A0A9R1XDG7_LACSA|nr:hypothetical protein LSAT_V11C500246840 [Lactuca sativa]